MTRALLSIIAVAILVSGCAGPVETRIETKLSAAMPAQKNYSFSSSPGEVDPSLAQAQQLVGEALDGMGFSRSEQATMLVDIALSDRPAEIAIMAGQDATEIAPAKERKPLQSCKDREHRISITLFSLPEGSRIYSGHASEHHCKGTISQSLPFLVDGAMSGMGGPVSNTSQSSIRERSGIE